MTSTERLRVGVVGAGAVSQLVHLPLLSARDDVELVAVSDRDEAKAATIAARFGVPSVVDDPTLFRDGSVDAVFVCTPNHLHEELTIAALEAGLHVLVERPLALTAEGCRRVLDTARAAARTVVVGMSHRFRPDVAALHSFIHGGELGRPYAARVAWMNRQVNVRRTTWRQRPEEAGGGAFMDLGVQSLDLGLWLLGLPRVTRVSAVMTRDGFEVEDAATVLVETEHEVALTIEVSWTYNASEDRHYARVLGTEGSGSLPPLEVFKQLGGRPMDVTPRQEIPQGAQPYLSAYRREIDQFIRTVQGIGSAPLPEDQVHLMEVVEAAYRSAKERTEVVL
ncbi:MAG: Gfo/Idh/MocA family oxidoreductase [Gemmatimonadetes bacterium]|nr:Gfo/Idh/MocA family oxidoreductase [Gemmatimonadota bacterium]NNF39310.1 Gfo/Idh/MocA family oxidoreductase [Gemmatimonadota bacterium]NNK64689.1 Gfo/Idh/MocA family oxidoreductase [Gemmatimonadota bacterium]